MGAFLVDGCFQKSTISRGFVIIIAKEEIEIGCYVIIYTRVFSFGLSFRLMISNEFVCSVDKLIINYTDERYKQRERKREREFDEKNVSSGKQSS